GKAIDIEDALLHHWAGAVFVPSVTLDDLLFQLQHVLPHQYQADVLTSAVLSADGDTMRTYLKIRRSKMMVTAVYNTEFDVAYRRWTPTRASSTTVATKIAELDEAGTPKER